MKKKLFLFTLISLLFINFCSSQALFSYASEGYSIEKDSAVNSKKSPIYEFRAYTKDSYLKNISIEMAGEHFLGDMIAKKIYLFNKFYTTEENLFPGDPATKTVIKKPVIHEAVKRIERDLIKVVKKGETSLSEASVIMNTVLDVVLNIQTEDTKAFEKALGTSSSTKSKIELFIKNVRLNY